MRTDPGRAVGESAVLVAETSDGQSWGVGRVVSYTDRPTYLLERPDGSRFSWIAGLCRPAAESELPDGRAAAVGDAVNHPSHYNSHPSGVECIDVVEHMTFNVGNAVKYLWRAGLKGGAIQDLRKAAWYIDREISKRSREEA